MLTRRTLLAGATLSWAALAAGCGAEGGVDPGQASDPKSNEESPVTVERRTYGDDPSQWAELHRPKGTSRGVVVVIHGGFWKAAYDASLGTPLAADLAQRGWTAWNIEYRRVGNGGGVPATLDDVDAAINALADIKDLDLSTVVTLGHSAGGHLGAWAAARGRFGSWTEAVPVTGVISQAGVLDLTGGSKAGLGGGAVDAFAGGPSSAAYDEFDPIRQVPLDVPVWCVHGTSDPIVPLSQSTAYVAAAVAASAKAELVEVDGDHFTLIDTSSQAWVQIVKILDALG